MQVQTKLEQAYTKAQYDFTAFKRILYKRYESPKHMQVIDRALTQCLKYIESGGKSGISRLIIEVPPRFGKTMTVSRLFPAWALGRNPNIRVMLVSYGDSLARKNSRIARNFMRSDYYKGIFPHVELADDSQSQNEWNIKGDEGGCDALGLEGSATGKGAHILICLTGDTLVTTSIGNVRIDELVAMQDKPLVLGYNHGERRTVWASIEATSVVKSTELIEIQTTSGKVVRSTPSHQFFVEGQGYILADRLKVGDTLKTTTPNYPRMRLVQKRVSKSRRGTSKIFTAQLHRFLLFQRMQQRASCNQECQHMRPLWQIETEQAKQQILLQDLQAFGTGERSNRVSLLQKDVCSPSCESAILLSCVCQQSSCRAHDRQGEFSFQGWDKLRQMVCGNEASDIDERPSLLRDLWASGSDDTKKSTRQDDSVQQFGNSSYGRKSAKQQSGKPRYHVQNMPRHTPQVESDTISAIKRVCSNGELVYDLQVEGTHNFFANEILTHNCDDLVKSRAEAESELMREKTWDAFTGDLYNRLEPNGVIVMMFTRWHSDDPVGRALQMTDEKWVRIHLPALAEENDPLGREIGESLWPERYSTDTLLKIKSAIGEYNFASQYQQRPMPSKAGLFDTAKIKLIDYAPPKLERVRFYDLAVTAKKHSDYTVGVLLGIDEFENIYILHVYRVQKTPVYVEQDIVDNAMLDGRDVRIRLEAEKAGIVQLDYLLKRNELRGFRLDAKAPDGDKYTRAQPIASRVNAEKVFMVRGEWNRAFLDELAVFPMGSHDDQVDALSGAYDALSNFQELREIAYPNFYDWNS